MGGIRQQFSVPENIQLSMYGMEFLRKSPELLAVEGLDTPDMQFNPNGYLTLASEEGYDQLRENYELQMYVYFLEVYSFVACRYETRMYNFVLAVYE